MGYAEEHIAFVSNLKGTSAACVLVCLAHAPLSVLLLKLVQKRKRPLLQRDLLYLVLPILLNLTILADYCYITVLMMLGLEIAFVLKVEREWKRRKMLMEDSSVLMTPCTPIHDVPSKLTYLTLFKGLNMLITCLVILAVDFRVFPRRFAKTETFGVSPMDVGVGTFIVSTAITSRFARGYGQNGSTTTTERETNTTESKSFAVLSHASWQRIAVLLFGVGRMVVLKTIDYHEHVSEYGVHWNFFVTLFSVWTLVDLLHRTCRRNLLPWLACAMLVLYQTVLICTDLTDFMFIAKRTNFLYANREGILSLCGYVPLYLIAECLSYQLFFNNIGVKHLLSSESSHEVATSPPSIASSDVSIVGGSGTCRSKGKTSGNHNNHTINTNSNSSSSNSTMIRQQRVPTGEMTSGIGGSNGFDKMNLSVVTTGSRINIAHNNDNNTNDGSLRTTTNNSTISDSAWDVLGTPVQRRLFQQLMVISMLLWLGWLGSSRFQQTSRRLANATFVLLSLALSFSIILLLAIVEAVGDRTGTIAAMLGNNRNGGMIDDEGCSPGGGSSSGGSEPSFSSIPPSTLPGTHTAAWVVPVCTLENINKYQLQVFLIANVMTGIINMSIQTIYIPHVAAFAILSLYATMVCGAAWAMTELYQPHCKP